MFIAIRLGLRFLGLTTLTATVACFCAQVASCLFLFAYLINCKYRVGYNSTLKLCSPLVNRLKMLGSSDKVKICQCSRRAVGATLLSSERLGLIMQIRTENEHKHFKFL